MDIICKCGHSVKSHTVVGCFVLGGCWCELSVEKVLLVHITEQQARLDTNRAQVEVLIAERDALKEEKRQVVSQLVEGASIIEDLRKIIDDLIRMLP